MTKLKPSFFAPHLYWAVMVLLVLLLGYCPKAMSQSLDTNNPLIGINLPLSGPYERMGKDELKAYELAIERLNEQGGVLGQKVEYKVMDSETNPKVARQNAVQLIEEYQADVITGGISSAVTIAQNAVAKEYEVPYLAALTHSTATTGFEQKGDAYGEQKVTRYNFRWHLNAWMTQKALIPYMTEKFDDGDTFYYITADYAWGYSLEHAFQHGTETAGFDTAGSTRTDLGQKDFTQAVENAEKAEPDVLVLTLIGYDLLNAMREVHQSDLDPDIPIVVPVMFLKLAHSLGPEITENVISTTSFYWEMQKQYSGSREFVSAYRDAYGEPPEMTGAAAWVAIMEWASAVERAGSFNSTPVVKELEGHTFSLLKDEERWRSWDHQAVSSVLILEGKSKDEMKGEWDLFRIAEEVPGSEVVRSREENPVMLGPLE